MKTYKILAINPGSTTTKIALFVNQEQEFGQTLDHDSQTILQFSRVIEQKDYRKQLIRDCLSANAIEFRFDAIVGRGGLLKAIMGGVYAINDRMINDLQSARYGEHPSNLGAIIAREFAEELMIPSFIVDPVATDEMHELARYTGIPQIKRRSIFHALSQRAAARQTAKILQKEYQQCRFIVAHLGGGISIGAHVNGLVLDVINALDGEGPFSPERSGSIPAIPLLDYFQKNQPFSEKIKQSILRQGGMFAYLGSKDMRFIEQEINSGNSEYKKIVDAMIYSIAKHISSMAPVMHYPAPENQTTLNLDAIVLTGGLANSPYIVSALTSLLNFLAPIMVISDMEEMKAMAAGVQLALNGQEIIKTY